MKTLLSIPLIIFFIGPELSASFDIPLNQKYADYTAQNSGKTGIIEMPNARVMDDWRIRANVHYNNPFTYFGLAIAPFPRLELNFRMTQIKGVPGFGDSAAYGDYKDKAIDVKFLLSKEDDVLPAVAIGFDDITGTGLYSSKYIALSKRFNFLDLTVGYAMGRMGGYAVSEYTGSTSSDDNAMDFLTSTDVKGNFFAGAELHVNPDIVLKAEYSPIDYSKDRVNAFTRGLVDEPKSDFNFGLTYNLTDKINLSANFERGNSFSIGARMMFPFKREGLYPHQPNPKWRASQKVKDDFAKKNKEELKAGIANEVAAEAFSNVQVALHKDKAWVGLENPRYDSDAQALGRAADAVDEVAPNKVKTLYMTLKYRNVDYLTVEMDREDLQALKQEPSLYANSIEKYLMVYDDPKKAYEKFSDGLDVPRNDSIGSKTFSFVHRPQLQTFLNAKDNPFVYRFTWLLGYRWMPWPGAKIQQRFRVPIGSSMDEIEDKTLEPEQYATRTDVLKYQQYDKIQMNDLSIDQIIPLPGQSLGRISLGYFEAAYAGGVAEWYKPLANGKYGIGLEYQKVWKREVDNFFGLEDRTFDAKFINAYANLSRDFGLTASLKVGQFLAGDKGYKLTVSRQMNGFAIGAYIAKTDTSIFTASENRDYVDKGIFIRIPLSVVKNKDVRGTLHYGLSAWTRDVAQTVSQSTSLIGTKMYDSYRFMEDIEKFKD